jgi:hypothetical protein
VLTSQAPQSLAESLNMLEIKVIIGYVLQSLSQYKLRRLPILH